MTRYQLQLCTRFSALQRAENSSIRRDQKRSGKRGARFSALQRAENSSIELKHEHVFVGRFCFSALQRAENSSMGVRLCRQCARRGVSVLFSEPKIPQSRRALSVFRCLCVSVLFSEPKIPQSFAPNNRSPRRNCFSALQRAENSSIVPTAHASLYDARRFSALQRAENSSILQCDANCQDTNFVSVLFSEPKIPQFDNALRKLLPREAVSVLFSEPKIPQLTGAGARSSPGRRSFSALQRAENSSIELFIGSHLPEPDVSVLFSEPKIPQSAAFPPAASPSAVSVLFSEPKIPQSSPALRTSRDLDEVSVLFSEPKIPQCNGLMPMWVLREVSVLFSEPKIPQYPRFLAFGAPHQMRFQCSSASRKFLNRGLFQAATSRYSMVSVLFSEPKIPQCGASVMSSVDAATCFSALQRAENSSIEPTNRNPAPNKRFQCSSASRKFLNQGGAK